MSIAIEWKRTIVQTWSGDLPASEIHEILDALVGGPAEAIRERIDALSWDKAEEFWTALTQRQGIEITESEISEDEDQTDWDQDDAVADRDDTSD